MRTTKAENALALRQRLPKISPWAAISIFLLVGITGYFGFLGVRYWSASNAVQSMERDLRDLSRQTRGVVPDEAVLALELEAQAMQLEGVRAVFEYRSTDQLTRLLSAAAKSSEVELLSVTTGEVSSVVKERIQYQTQPVNIALRGAAADIYRFLATVREEAPTLSIAGFRMTGLDSVPSAQIELMFYMAPEKAPEKAPTTIPGVTPGVVPEVQDG